MAFPNYQHEVAAAAARWPEAWSHAHREGDPRTEDFIRLIAAHLFSVDPRVGLNGKRGNPNDISDDALAVFSDDGDVTDRTGRRMFVVDCIVGAGGPSPSAGWSSVGGPSPGAWVQPDELLILPNVPQQPTSGGSWEPKHAAMLAQFPPRTHAIVVAEQFAFSFPGEGWHHKNAGGARPTSKDVMARQFPDGRVVGYSVETRTGQEITDIRVPPQVLEQTTPTNHLGLAFVPPVTSLPGGTPGQGAPPDPIQHPPAGSPDPTLLALILEIAALRKELTEPVEWPEYEGSLLGYTLLLKPKDKR